jgi:hypothetical protein
MQEQERNEETRVVTLELRGDEAALLGNALAVCDAMTLNNADAATHLLRCYVVTGAKISVAKYATLVAKLSRAQDMLGMGRVSALTKALESVAESLKDVSEGMYLKSVIPNGEN